VAYAYVLVVTGGDACQSRRRPVNENVLWKSIYCFASCRRREGAYLQEQPFKGFWKVCMIVC